MISYKQCAFGKGLYTVWEVSLASFIYPYIS